jgi:hypothetical protein
MSHQDKVAFLPLSYFLLLVAISAATVATLLLIFFTTAATDTGGKPASAIALVQGLNTGVLGPNQERWFRLRLDQPLAGAEHSLSLVFTPAYDHLIQYISLRIFEQSQVQFFDSVRMASFGMGQFVSHDLAGELFWEGSLATGQVYYIQLRNESDSPIDYRLSLKEKVIPVPVLTEPEMVAPPPVTAAPALGADPASAIPLSPGPRQGKLAPQTVLWHVFTPAGAADGDQFQDLTFSLFFTPGDGNDKPNLNFKLFTAEAVGGWPGQSFADLSHFGAGSLVSRDGDPNTGERIWRGALLKGNTYFLAIENDSPIAVDYQLFDQDIFHPELSAQPAPASAPAFAAGAAPQTAIPLNFDLNTGRLASGQEIWYSFSRSDYDEDYFEEMALTMVATPDDDQRIQRVTFDIFTVDGIRNWSPGSNTGLNNVGAGSIVYRDNNPLTGERFWGGWVVDNALYYVRLQNGTDAPVDYWLFTGDVYQPELGQHTGDGH